MGVHPQRHRLVTVAQLFGDTGNICPVSDCHASEAVPELVRVQAGDIVPLGEFLQIAGGRLWVHRLLAVILIEHPN